MSKMHVPLFVVLLSFSLLEHSATAQYTPPPASAPVCEGSRQQCAGATSGSSSSGSMNSSLQGQVASTIFGAFFQFLTSTDSGAEAQKQQMMHELQQRKAEAERQHKIEEAQRLEAICNRLSATLKLNGLPDLQMKDVPTSGGELRLKLGDDDNAHVDVRGLPGIALNDNTGNGGSTPYGIAGLPGIYTNGPGSGSGSASLRESKLQLKTDDEVPPMQVAGNPSPPTSLPAQSEGISDPRNMTPKQLADVATQISKLPPEEQQRLMNAAQNAANSNSQNVINGAPSQSVPSGAASQPVGSQLQQIAGTSQSAASAPRLADARTQAGLGFDQAAGSALIPAKPQIASTQSAPSGTTASSQTASGSTNQTTLQSLRVSVQAPAQKSSVDLRGPDQKKPNVVTQLSKGTAERATGCPLDSTKKLPTREELARELAMLRFKLNVLKSSLSRLNRAIQMDQGQFAEWEKETQDAVDRSKEQLKEAIADRVEGKFFDYAKTYYADAPEKLDAVEHVEVLLKENDVYDWAEKGGKSWEQFGEGLSLLGDKLPITENAKDVLWASKNMIDSAFEISTELVSWRRISQLKKNSDAYLAAVNQSGEQMRRIVTRIRDVEDSLATGTYAKGSRTVQPNAPVCE